MRGYVLSRLGWGIVIVLCILILNFLIVHLVPGDPCTRCWAISRSRPATPKKMRADFGLDQPSLTQLGLYLQHLARGDLGFSFANRMPVLDLIIGRLGPTLLLMLPALFMAAVLGVTLGVTAAPRAGSAQDGVLTAISLFGYSVPIFWLGQMLVIVFAIQLGWLPVSGMRNMRASAQGIGAWLDVAWHLLLPALSVTIYYLAVVARVARASVIEALHHDYVLTAKAKGLSKRYILWHHVFAQCDDSGGHCHRLQLRPIAHRRHPGRNRVRLARHGQPVHYFDRQSRLSPCSRVSSWSRRYPVVLVNLLTDLLYAFLDPRVRTHR